MVAVESGIRSGELIEMGEMAQRLLRAGDFVRKRRRCVRWWHALAALLDGRMNPFQILHMVKCKT